MHSKLDIVFSISIVSHGHRELVLALLDDFARLGRRDIEVILTWNLKSENATLDAKSYPFPLTILQNGSAKGFAANHNAAFQHCRGKNFVLLNPDIRLLEDPYPALVELLNSHPNAICAPIIVNSRFEIEDSARPFPSPSLLIKKSLAKILRVDPPSEKVATVSAEILQPEWIAGMFMVIPKNIFLKLGGLSEKYFLYYEDVDFCARAAIEGIKILVTTRTKAIHDARRESHRRPKYLLWHMKSAAIFFCSPAYLRMKIFRIKGK